MALVLAVIQVIKQQLNQSIRVSERTLEMLCHDYVYVWKKRKQFNFIGTKSWPLYSIISQTVIIKYILITW